jgi:DNA replication and repair protein RecF
LRLAEITPHSFRNLSPDAVAVGNGVTLVTGDNAQGKTNLLEAIAVLSGQRSFRGARPSEMAPEGGSLSVSGVLRRGFDSERLSLSWSRPAGRRFARGEKSATFREASALLPAVFLAPEHRDLVEGAPSVRRRFLDRLVLGLYPAAGDELARYEMALQSRNALLARWRDRRGEPEAGELEAWTEELARSGTAVRVHRRRALEEWRAFFSPLSGEHGPAFASIETVYGAADEQNSGETSVAALRAACERLLPAERRRGYCLAGPHRDDLLWTRGGKPLHATASSGEVHRVAALARLAQWHAVAGAAEEPPFFGADDFDMGLSPAAADAFWAFLPEGAVVILTTASDPAPWRRKAAAVYEMRQGSAVAREARRAVND